MTTLYKEYKQVVDANPGNAMAVKGLTRAFYLKAAKETSGAFLANNDFETAEAALQEAIKLNPADLELRLAEAKMRSLSGKPVDLRTVGTPRNNAERFAYAEALLSQNNFREAAAQMHTVITSVNTAREAAQVGELAMLIRDLESAEAAFKRAKSLPGGNDRATRGLAAVAKAREQSRQDFTLAQDLASRKQLNSAIDKYRASIYAFPTFPASRLGLAKTLERLSKPQPEQLRESARNYRAYTELAVNLPQKDHAKFLKHATALDERAYKIEQKNVVAARK